VLRKWHCKVENRRARKLEPQDTAIVDLGASGFYVIPGAPVSDIDPSAPRVSVGTVAAGQLHKSTARCKIPLKGMPPDLFARSMRGFQHSLLDIGIMCDKDCKVLFTKRCVAIYDKNGKPFLTGWRELTGSKLWSVSLQPELESVEP
jgi:hypothetical protein